LTGGRRWDILEALPRPKEGVPTLLGVVLVVLGTLAAAALVDLVIEATSAGSTDLALVGSSIGSWSAVTALLIVAVLGALCGALLVSGIVMLSAARRRRRDEEERERRVGEAQKRETMRRLLQERVDQLAATVRELEARKDELRDEAATARSDPTRDDAVIVLPDAPQADRTPGGSRP
jgi:uncharacterized membrane protein YccC